MHEEIIPFLAQEADAPLSFPIVGISYCDGSYRIQRPQSSIACVEYILSGSGTVQIDGKTYHPTAGDTYFLPAGHDHLYFSSEEEPWVKIWANISGPLVTGMTEAYGLDEKCYFPGLYTGDLLRSILRVAEERKADGILSASLLLHEIFYRMSRAHETRTLNRTAVALRDFIDLHYTEALDASSLAEAVGKSASQCSRLFMQAYGVTPYRYLLGRRISLARVLLESSSMSVKEIAAQLSFCDEYYFSNLFKQKVGVSPAAYRAGSRGE
jgi:AraC-like DNA-binding protein